MSRRGANAHNSLKAGVEITQAREEDAVGIASITANSMSHDTCEPYYFAMLGSMYWDTAFVARDKTNNTIGGLYGFRDAHNQSLLITHVACDAALTTERAREVKRDLLTTAAATAKRDNVATLKGYLDIGHDPDLEDVAKQVGATSNIAISLAFNEAARHRPDINQLAQSIDTADIRPEDIKYRHPDPNDAVNQAAGIRAIINKIQTLSEDGGLDLFPLHIYETLLRDTPKTCMLAMYNDQVVGFATGIKMPDNQGMILWQTGVDPDWQKKRIGSTVEKKILDEHTPDYVYFTVVDGYQGAQATADKKAKYLDNMRQDLAITYQTPHVMPRDNLGGNKPERVYYIGPRPMPLTFG